MPHECSKHYGHWEGLSTVYRQWRADSHCSQLHGYALSVQLDFIAETLDQRSWILDFGGLKPIREWLHNEFDHKLLITKDDPKFEDLFRLKEIGVADVSVWDRPTSCESFAEYVGLYLVKWLAATNPKVRVARIKIAEHEGNSATWTP